MDIIQNGVIEKQKVTFEMDLITWKSLNVFCINKDITLEYYLNNLIYQDIKNRMISTSF